MISFFPDLNVWLALSFAEHTHNGQALQWLTNVPQEAQLLFSRFTQIGLLRLLTNSAVMGNYVNTAESGWRTYDYWLRDSRVQFLPEPSSVEFAFRQITSHLPGTPASKWIADCYLLAFAKESGATLVTFDRALAALARKDHCRAIVPGYSA